MRSHYQIKVFSEKLDELTKSGNPLLKGNPLSVLTANFSDKPFYGFVSESEFKITRNANVFVIPYVIHGTFRKIGQFTDVSYKIVLITFGYYWIRILPLFLNMLGVVLLAINYKLLDFQNLNYIKVLFVLLLLEALLLLPLIITEISKNKFEKEFLKQLLISCN